MIKHLTLPKKMAAMVLLAGAALSIAPVQAASWPTKQIELVVPYAAGGGTDLVARAFADAAKNHLPVSIGVINKPGGGGAIGLSEIAAARPGGYKIGLGTVELTTLPSLGMVRFKTSDFKPIARLNTDPAAITVRADAPWNSYEEFMTYAKANPGKVRIGNSGTGAIWHLAAAALEDKTGAKFSHVPYDGAAPAITGLLGGHIEAVSVSPGEVINHVKGGKLKTLVVMADERMKTMPDVPTLKEKGVDLSIGTWRGLIVSQKTPQDVVDRFHGIIKKSFEEFGITFDIYSRTTSPTHRQVASDFFRTLYEKGEFIEKTSEQYYDEEAKQFLADRYITGTCPHCGNEKAYGDQCEACGTSLSQS